MNKKAFDFLCELLNCGYRDVEFLLNFIYEPGDLIDYVKHSGLELEDVNSLIYAGFQLFLGELCDIVENFKDGHPEIVEVQKLDVFEDFEWYINALDSSIELRKNEEIYKKYFSELNNFCKQKLGMYLW